MQSSCFLSDYEPMLILSKLSDFPKMMHMDVASRHAPEIHCAADTIGADRFVLGSDCPMVLTLKGKAQWIIDEIDLPEMQKARMPGGAAKIALTL